MVEGSNIMDKIFVCPECGGKQFTHKTVIEDTDADGNRGRPVTYAKCAKCGNEIGT
jgi:predicted nucleic-acid-binding Zn-ribbon protein